MHCNSSILCIRMPHRYCRQFTVYCNVDILIGGRDLALGLVGLQTALRLHIVRYEHLSTIVWRQIRLQSPMKSKCDGARQLTLIRTKWFRLLLVVWWDIDHIPSIWAYSFPVFCMFFFIIFIGNFFSLHAKMFHENYVDVSWRACIISSISMEWMDAKKAQSS